MTQPSKRVEEIMEEFEDRFGGTDKNVERYLCLYNSTLGYSDHHLVVKDWLTTTLTQLEQQAVESERR